jgi:hypothetical protein
MKRSRYTKEQIIGILKEQEAGVPGAELCRKHGHGKRVHEHLTDGERFDHAYEFAARRLAEEFHTAAVIEHEKLGMYAARRLIGTGVAGGPNDITRVVELLEARGIRLKGEHGALVVGVFDEKARATNTAQIRIEQSLAESAKAAARAMTRRAVDPSDRAGDRRQRHRLHAGAAGRHLFAWSRQRPHDAHRCRRRRQDDAA